MASHLRNPQEAPPPAGVEERRLKVYRDLIYNNVEGFVRGGFPVLRSLYADDDWHALVRAFLDGHRCRSPYFLEISQEFIGFLMEGFVPRECDPPFLIELAHYDWVELALDVSEQEIPPPLAADDVLAVTMHLSPLAWVLSYQYPVHRIGPRFRPTEAGEPVYLVVYRDRQDAVRFMELNAATARLLELVRDNERATGAGLLDLLARELGMEAGALHGFGAQQLQDFAASGIVVA